MVISVDATEDVRQSKLSAALEKIRMFEIITQQQKGPSTYDRGYILINEMYVS